MSKLNFRNHQGELVEIQSVAATQLKNEFGSILERAILGGAVAITKHNAPKAVLISFAEFESLANSRSANLDGLRTQFDDLLARMQTAKSKKGMAAAFSASPAELGQNAAKSRKR
ncbi:MAG: type II toxin-antitoxin system Phd/YefM family antitoxin [Burkholderiales bacterium]